MSTSTERVRQGRTAGKTLWEMDRDEPVVAS